jgi:hypothetical protein
MWTPGFRVFDRRLRRVNVRLRNGVRTDSLRRRRSVTTAEGFDAMIRPRSLFAALLSLYGLAAKPGPRVRPGPIQIGARSGGLTYASRR